MRWLKFKKRQKDDLNVCPICKKDCKTVDKYRKHVRDVHQGR